ncbi:hypothetical protein [Streptomyces sp. NPDC007083]|uniref:hypothetical protein n=1 Tax=Streptomyces sp. NPDC007083 TaxID=3156913 RepID=UPI0033FD6DE0
MTSDWGAFQHAVAEGRERLRGVLKPEPGLGEEIRTPTDLIDVEEVRRQVVKPAASGEVADRSVPPARRTRLRRPEGL